MNIIYKSTLSEEQLLSRNKVICDGVEIQMFKTDETFENLTKLKKRVHSIHYPYCKEACYLKNVILNLSSDFVNTVKTASECNAFVILHNDEFLLDVMRYDKEIVKKNLETLSRYINVKFSIENVPTSNTIHQDRKDTCMDIPGICNYLNKLAGKELFYPLLDICHLVQTMNTSTGVYQYGIEDVILAYQSRHFNIHFNYALGDGKGNNHGVTFQSNPMLFKKNHANIVYFRTQTKSDFGG